MTEHYKYWAFISYSHQDRAWGDWLHKTLETYRVPRHLVGQPSRDGQVPARLFPIFRDRDELPSSANLGDVLNESLRDSRYQIVICSPRSATSRWVNEEIKYFKSLGREDRVLCLIVDGEPHMSNVPRREGEECFAPALRHRVDRNGQITGEIAEPIAADAREHADGKRGARLKLLSGLLGVGYDELVQREKQRQFWQRIQQTVLAACVIGLFAGGWQWFAAQRTAREREIVVERLTESGRLELLAGHHARAAVLLNEAYKRGKESLPLRFMLAQAMKPVEALTDIRVQHGGIAAFRSAFSLDGRQFAIHALTKGTGTQQAVIKLYDTATGALLEELPDAPALPLTLSFLPDGRRLIASGFPDDNYAGAPFTRLWDLDTPQQPLRLDGINGLAGRGLNPEGTRLLIAGADGLRVHDARSGELLAHWLRRHSVLAAAYSPDGSTIATADASGQLRLLSAGTGQVIQELPEAHGLSIAALLFTPNGKELLALTGRDDNHLLQGDIRIWNLETGLLRLSFAAMREYLSDVQFDHKGESLLTVGAEGYKVWTTGRGILQLSLPRSLREYARATLSPDGGTLITADFQNKVAEAWDVASGQLAYSLDWHTDGVSTVTFNPSGTLLLLGSRDGSASLWRMPVTPDWRYESYDTAPYSVRFARGGTELLVGGGIGSGQVQLFDLHTGAFTQRLDGHAAAVVDARFSPDGSRIATASLDGSLGLWDAAGGQRLATMEHNPLGAYLIEFNASGNRLLSTTDSNILSDEDAVGLWNGEDGQHLAWLRHPSKITAAHFDPAGERIVTAGFDKRVRIWDAQDGRRLLELPEQGGLIASARFSRDGQRILTAAYDSAVRIFDSGDGRLLDQLVEPGIGMAGNALFSPDESQIAIATEAGDIWLWSVGKRQMKVLKGHAQLADQLRFSPDGALLFSGGVDGTLRVWDTQTGRALSMLASLGRPLASLDVDWVDSSLAAANWTQFIVIGIATERRPTAAIAAVLRCRNPWRAGADPVALVAMPPAADCAGNIERR